MNIVKSVRAVSRFGTSGLLQNSKGLASASAAPEGMTRKDAVRGFRKILRSVIIVFRNDTGAIEAARKQLKEEFRKHAHVTNAKELKEHFVGISEVDEMLRFNIVQARMNNRGNYGVDLTREETKVVLEAGKDLPQGVEVAPVDASSLGDPMLIKITKSKGTASKK